MKYIYLSSFLIIFFFLGCTKDFESINDNPNAPTEVRAQYLLSNVISVAANESTYQQGFRLANYLEQFAASIEFERIDRYEMGTNSAYWNTLYSLLSDIQSMKNAQDSNEAYAAVGNIMRCHIFSQLTDMWGDVPYTEATAGLDGNYTPVYDKQKNIYLDPETGILAVLQDAVNTLQNTNASIQGDMMFNNNLKMWIRFGNSLQIRYIMRISKRLDDFSRLETLASANIMQNNADNAVVPYLNTAPYRFPLSQTTIGIYLEHRMTKTVDSIATLWNDPRIKVLYKPTEKSVSEGNPQYKGLQNGMNRETISERGIDLNDISLYGSIFRDQPDGVNAQFMQYAELQFALAEAVERGFIEGDVQSYYRNGIEASFKYYNVDIPSDYYDNPEVALNGSDNLEKILTQKWFSLNTVGHEAWFNVRRTGIPHLKPGPDNLNSDRYPVRYLYPQSEQATNSDNCHEATSRMELGDNINSKNWWEEGSY